MSSVPKANPKWAKLLYRPSCSSPDATVLPKWGRAELFGEATPPASPPCPSPPKAQLSVVPFDDTISNTLIFYILRTNPRARVIDWLEEEAGSVIWTELGFFLRSLCAILIWNQIFNITISPFAFAIWNFCWSSNWGIWMGNLHSFDSVPVLSLCSLSSLKFHFFDRASFQF